MNSLSRSCTSLIACQLSCSWGASEFEAAFASGIGQGFHPAVVEVGAAVEDDLGDACRLAALRDQLADALGGGRGRAALDARLEVLVDRRGRSDRATRRIINYLRVDVLVRAEDRKTRTPIGARFQSAADVGFVVFCFCFVCFG